MIQLRRRILSYLIIILAIFSLVFSFVSTRVIENQSLELQENEAETQLITLISQLNPESLSEYNLNGISNQLERASAFIDERISLIANDGEVIYDSHFGAPELDNHSDRPEIQEARETGDIATTVRNSETSEMSLFYSAAPITDDSGSTIGVLRIARDVAGIANLTTRVNTYLIIFMIISGIATVLITNYWTRKIGKPLLNIKEVTYDLSDRNYEARYSSHSYNEIDEIGHSINELAENLQQQVEQNDRNSKRMRQLLQHLVSGVILINDDREILLVNPAVNEILDSNLYSNLGRDYSEVIQSADIVNLIEKSIRKKKPRNAEITLYLQNERIVDVNVLPIEGKTEEEYNYIIILYDITEIRRLEKVRTDFVANASHELRTPITALKGFSETLLDGALDDREILIEFLEIMHKESTRLDSMVQDILQLSRLEQKPTTNSADKIRISDVVNEVFQILQQKAEIKDITCTINEKGNHYAYVNHDELKQVLINLVGNAISYSPEGRNVTVNIFEENNESVIEIEDDGIGIPEEHQKRIFERFYRVDKARSRNAGGTGLGLSIVKWLVEGMDGHIELESELDKGSKFTIYLPNQY